MGHGPIAARISGCHSGPVVAVIRGWRQGPEEQSPALRVYGEAKEEQAAGHHSESVRQKQVPHPVAAAVVVVGFVQLGAVGDRARFQWVGRPVVDRSIVDARGEALPVALVAAVAGYALSAGSAVVAAAVQDER